MVEALQEPFTLTQADAAITATDGLHSTAYGTIYSYLVPVGIGHIILPGHTISMYLYGDDASEMPNTTLVRVLLQDASAQDRKAIMGPILYASLRNFTDRDQMARFSVPEPVKVFERQYIIVEMAGQDVAGTAGQTATGSYFEMHISRVRQPL